MNTAQQQLIAGLPPMTEDATWRALAPCDHHRIECERFHVCQEYAVWASRQGEVSVCAYHRFLLEVERTLQSMDREQLTAR